MNNRNCSVFLDRDVFMRDFQRKNQRIAGVCPSAQQIGMAVFSGAVPLYAGQEFPCKKAEKTG